MGNRNSRERKRRPAKLGQSLRVNSSSKKGEKRGMAPIIFLEQRQWGILGKRKVLTSSSIGKNSD